MVHDEIEVLRIPKQEIASEIEPADQSAVSINGNLEELIKQIEELRSSMINIKEGRSYTDPEVITSSQELDAVLNKYQEMMMRNKVDTDQE